MADRKAARHPGRTGGVAMTRKRYLFVSFLFIFLLLFPGGCSRTVEQTDGSEDAGGLTMKAAFEEEDGTPLSNCTVRFSDGKNSADYQADQDGALTISGLPTGGELTASVLDGQEEPQGTVILSFSRGAVIDAVTSEDGVGHITIRSDTDEVALLFVLQEDGTLTCTLWLTTNVEGDNYGTPSL